MLRPEVLNGFLGQALHCLNALQQATGEHSVSRLCINCPKLCISNNHACLEASVPAPAGGVPAGLWTSFLHVMSTSASLRIFVPELRFQVEESHVRGLLILALKHLRRLFQRFLQRRSVFTKHQLFSWLGQWGELANVIYLSSCSTATAKCLGTRTSLLYEVLALLLQLLPLLRTSCEDPCHRVESMIYTSTTARLVSCLCRHMLAACNSAGAGAPSPPLSAARLLLVLEAVAVVAASTKAVMESGHILRWDDLLQDLLGQALPLFNDGLKLAVMDLSGDFISEETASLQIAATSAAETMVRLGGALVGLAIENQGSWDVQAALCSVLVGAKSLLSVPARLAGQHGTPAHPASGRVLASIAKLVHLAASQPRQALLDGVLCSCAKMQLSCLLHDLAAQSAASQLCESAAHRSAGVACLCRAAAAHD